MYAIIVSPNDWEKVKTLECFTPQAEETNETQMTFSIQFDGYVKLRFARIEDCNVVENLLGWHTISIGSYPDE
jgi:hypothetical protein